MDRRLFTSCLALGVLAAQLAKAQQARKTYQIGYLALGSALTMARRRPRCGRRWPNSDTVEGKNVTYVGRWAESMRARLPALAVELVALKVDVIVTETSGAARAAKNATSDIPIVMALSTDPVGQGLIASLARPGGNVTGMSDNAIDLSAKRLELLKEAVPTVSRIAVLWNERDSAMTQRYREIDRAAQALGVSIQPLGVREPDDFERAFSAMNRERPDAMIMVTDVLTNLNRKRVLDYAEAHRIPAMYEFASFVREDGLMSYGPSDDYLFGRAAVYVDKILKGAKPSELPAEEPIRSVTERTFKESTWPAATARSVRAASELYRSDH
jgi:putative ABC transport system substrate-binding protein